MRFIGFLLLVALAAALVLLASPVETLTTNPPVPALVALGLIILLATVLAFRPRTVHNDAATAKALAEMKAAFSAEQSATREALAEFRGDLMTITQGVEASLMTAAENLQDALADFGHRLGTLDDAFQRAQLQHALPELMAYLRDMPELDPEIPAKLGHVKDVLPLATEVAIGFAKLRNISTDEVRNGLKLLHDLGQTTESLNMDDLQRQIETLQAAAMLKELQAPARISAEGLSERLEVFRKSLNKVVTEHYNDYTNRTTFKRIFLKVFHEIARDYTWASISPNSTDRFSFKSHIVQLLNSCSGFDDFAVEGETASYMVTLFLNSNRT